MVLSCGHRSLRVSTCDDKQVLVVVPVALDHIAFERLARADLHRQHSAWLRDGLELDVLAESNVTVADGFGFILALAPDAERRNPKADFHSLCHVVQDNDPDRECHASVSAGPSRPSGRSRVQGLSSSRWSVAFFADFPIAYASDTIFSERTMSAGGGIAPS